MIQEVPFKYCLYPFKPIKKNIELIHKTMFKWDFLTMVCHWAECDGATQKAQQHCSMFVIDF
jgi:hypothetical protein